ncbi:MAG: helix-turn-helix transcriptional regulator [Betaproteobacteria bacterium]|nr:helix-turn-helix transcriptional regulator [Betaproteobacteria bacterium]
MSKTFTRTQQALAINTRRYRLERGLSQEGLALEAGIDRTYTSQIERGIANPSLKILCQIATVLRVNPENLIT